jgi:hypothetical protein
MQGRKQDKCKKTGADAVAEVTSAMPRQRNHVSKLQGFLKPGT